MDILYELPVGIKIVSGLTTVQADAKRAKGTLSERVQNDKELEYVIENLGFRQLHFSNTFPHPKGAMSGSVLRPYTIELIRMVREVWGNDIEIIAGGGVRDLGAVMEYLAAGANHISFGSVCFNPFKLRKLLKTMKGFCFLTMEKVY